MESGTKYSRAFFPNEITDRYRPAAAAAKLRPALFLPDPRPILFRAKGPHTHPRLFSCRNSHRHHATLRKANMMAMLERQALDDNFARQVTSALRSAPHANARPPLRKKSRF